MKEEEIFSKGYELGYQKALNYTAFRRDMAREIYVRLLSKQFSNNDFKAAAKVAVKQADALIEALLINDQDDSHSTL